MKRAAEKQLSKDDLEEVRFLFILISAWADCFQDVEETEGQQGFQKADEDTLATRKCATLPFSNHRNAEGASRIRGLPRRSTAPSIPVIVSPPTDVCPFTTSILFLFYSFLLRVLLRQLLPQNLDHFKDLEHQGARIRSPLRHQNPQRLGWVSLHPHRSIPPRRQFLEICQRSRPNHLYLPSSPQLHRVQRRPSDP